MDFLRVSCEPSLIHVFCRVEGQQLSLDQHRAAKRANARAEKLSREAEAEGTKKRHATTATASRYRPKGPGISDPPPLPSALSGKVLRGPR